MKRLHGDFRKIQEVLGYENKVYENANILEEKNGNIGIDFCAIDTFHVPTLNADCHVVLAADLARRGADAAGASTSTERRR